jgi:hypothetical protein
MIHGGREPDQLVGCQVDAFLDALGDLEFALAGEQFHRAHFAHVHTDWIRGAPEFSVYSGNQGRRDFSGFFLIILGAGAGLFFTVRGVKWYYKGLMIIAVVLVTYFTVDDMGKYSVRPSTMAMMMDSKIVMADQEDFPFFMMA